MKRNILLIGILLLINIYNVNAQTQLWGTTQLAYPGVFGTIYTISNGDSISYVHEFADLQQGAPPTGAICMANNGYIYGTTSQGGMYNKGTIYKINPNTYAFTKIYDFSNATGGWCERGLMKGTDGNLYGTTNQGGAFNYGVLFKLDPLTDSYSVLCNLDTTTGSIATVWEMINNKLYGLTNNEGANRLGTIFSFDLGTNIFTVLHNNDSLTGCRTGTLLHLGGGLLIGTTSAYFNSLGLHEFGVLYSYDVNTNTRTILHSFDSINGFGVLHKIIRATDGKIYGTAAGGAFNYTSTSQGDGVLFSFDLNTNTYTALYNFDNVVTGRQSQCGIMQASNGLLYSATHGLAKVISYDIISNTLSIVSDFTGLTLAAGPYCPIIEVGSVTSIDKNNSIGNLSLMPNPAQDYILINNSDQSSVVICTDILGKEIDQIQLAGFGKTRVDVSNYPNVFFVKNNNGEVIKVMKN